MTRGRAASPESAARPCHCLLRRCACAGPFHLLRDKKKRRPARWPADSRRFRVGGVADKPLFGPASLTVQRSCHVHLSTEFPVLQALSLGRDLSRCPARAPFRSTAQEPCTTRVQEAPRLPGFGVRMSLCTRTVL